MFSFRHMEKIKKGTGIPPEVWSEPSSYLLSIHGRYKTQVGAASDHRRFRKTARKTKPCRSHVLLILKSLGVAGFGSHNTRSRYGRFEFVNKFYIGEL